MTPPSPVGPIDTTLAPPAEAEAAPRLTTEERAAYLALVAMAICFGGTWVTGKWAVDAFDPGLVAVLRFAIASLLLWGWARIAGLPLAPIRVADLPLIAGLGLTAIAGYNVLFLFGLTLAPASDGAIIVPGIAPILTVILAAITLRERLRAAALLGFAIALVGLVLVVGPSGGFGSSRFLGDLLFVVGAACWAIYTVLGRVAGRRYDPLSTTLYGAVVGTLALIPLALVGGLADLVAATPLGWIGIGYLAVFGTVAAFVLLHYALRRVGAGRASAFALLVPIVGVVSSALVLGEQLTPLTLVGGALILVGLWVVQRQPH